MNNVKFYLAKRTKDTAKTKIPVVLAFHYTSHRFYMQTPVKVYSNEWDAKEKRVKARVAGSMELNTILENLKNEVQAIYLKGLAEGASIDNKYFLSRLSLKKKSKEQSGNKFFQDWERFLELRSGRLLYYYAGKNKMVRCELMKDLLADYRKKFREADAGSADILPGPTFN